MKKKNEEQKTEIPAAPEWLDESGRAEYTRLLGVFEASEIDLQPSDADVLARYSQDLADYTRLQKQIREEGETVLGYRGSKVKNPALSVLKQVHDRLKDAGHRLGLSPAARFNVPKVRRSY